MWLEQMSERKGGKVGAGGDGASPRGPGGFHPGGGAPEGRELSTFEQGPSGYLEGTARDGGR